jgi:hypothetical protein
MVIVFTPFGDFCPPYPPFLLDKSMNWAQLFALDMPLLNCTHGPPKTAHCHYQQRQHRQRFPTIWVNSHLFIMLVWIRGKGLIEHDDVLQSGSSA